MHTAHTNPAVAALTNLSNNEKAVLARVEEKRKAITAIAEAKGLTHPKQPWQQVVKAAKAILEPNATRERTGKALDVVLKGELVKLYKRAMKEERPTETELEVSRDIGRILIAAFHVDLSTLG